VGLDNQVAQTLTGFAPRIWDWANNNQAGLVSFQVVEPGVHTLRLWQREDGLRLDRIVLTTDNNYYPLGDGPPESEFR
jgi:hypothetical protein